MKTQLQLNSFRAEGSNCGHSDTRQYPLPQAGRETDTHIMMWFGQTGLKVNQFETGLSASVNGLKLAFRNNNWLVKPLLLLTTRVLAHNQGFCSQPGFLLTTRVLARTLNPSSTVTVGPERMGKFPYSNVG